MSNLTGKFRTLRDTYEEQGVTAVGSEIKDYFITGGAAEHTKKILGKRYYIKLYTYNRLGYWPQIKKPRTFNEKIQHRKLYTDNELFSIVEDKWRVREYVEERVGNDILPEVYHVTEDPETIPFEELPDEYVIKPTHMSGPIIFVDEYESPDRSSVIQSCREWLDTTYGEMKEEYWYGEIPPRIIVEQKLYDNDYYLPRDFKFYVFHGKVKAVGVYQIEWADSKKTLNYYTSDWDKIDIIEKGYKKGDELSKPETFDKMVEISEKLGEDFDHIRVDLYTPNDEDIVFGELTVAEGSGGNPFVPQEYDFKFGSYW